MAKYVKCIDNYNITRCLDVGEKYEVLDECSDKYKIEDERGHIDWYNKDLFSKLCEKISVITFTSQEDFENAVMGVIIKRLNVCDYSKDGRIYFDVEDAFKEGK